MTKKESEKSQKETLRGVSTGQTTQKASQANVGHTWFFLGRFTLVCHNSVCILVATCGASTRHIPSGFSLSMPRAGI